MYAAISQSLLRRGAASIYIFCLFVFTDTQVYAQSFQPLRKLSTWYTDRTPIDIEIVGPTSLLPDIHRLEPGRVLRFGLERAFVPTFHASGSDHAGASALRLAQASDAPAFRKCPRTGSVRIKIGRHQFDIPRTVLASITLPNGQYERRWRCEDVEVEARSFNILVVTHAGEAFYKSWISEKRLPPEIEISARGKIINFTAQFLAKSSSNNISAKDAVGFDVTRTRSSTFFDASPFGLFGHGQHRIVFMCSSKTLVDVGHRCRVSYPYDDVVDVTYGFTDTQFPETEWVELDARVRELLKSFLGK